MLKSDLAINAPAETQLQRGSFKSFVSKNISVLEVQGGAIDIRKSASQSADVHLLRVQRGTVELSHAEGSTILEAGHFVAFRGAQALQFRHEQSIDLQAVFLRAKAIERWLPDWQAAEFVTITNNQAEGRLSFDIARDLLECGGQLQDATASEVVGDTVARLMSQALALTALNEAVAPADLAEAHRRKVRQFCRKHLGSHALTVDVVARGTGLSRATLHRLFHDQPHTLMQWVQLERLEACRRSLAMPEQPRLTLTELALAHGFKSPAHFSTAFRQRYGASPREYRAVARAERTRES